GQRTGCHPKRQSGKCSVACPLAVLHLLLPSVKPVLQPILRNLASAGPTPRLGTGDALAIRLTRRSATPRRSVVPQPMCRFHPHLSVSIEGGQEGAPFSPRSVS